MSEDNTLKNIKSMLSEYPKEVQDLMIMSGLLHLDVQNAIDNPVDAKQKIINEINEEIEKLSLTELALISYLIKTMRLNKEQPKVNINKEVQNLRQESFKEGFNKGKELRIKELKKMREF